MGQALGFGLGMGFTLVLHFRVTLAVAVNCAIYAVWLSVFYLGYVFEIGFRDGFWVWGWVGVVFDFGLVLVFGWDGARLGLVLFEGRLLIGGRGNPCTTLALSSLTTDQ